MITESQIREKLARYLSKEITLDQFEDWFTQQSWNMHKDSEPESKKLAGAVELRLAEHSSGHLSESALRDELRQFANPHVVQISFGQVSPQSTVQEAPNNVAVEGRPQVIVFRSQVAPPLEGRHLGAVVSSDREQLVAFG